MHDAVTVVISAAGLGTRLGLNLPKALVEVGGLPILRHQLDALSPEQDVVVVAGFRSDRLVALVRELRPTVRVALNHAFATTGTAASLARGSAGGEDWIVTLDGDLLVAPGDLNKFLEQPGPCLGLAEPVSAAPVWAHLGSDGEVVELSQTRPSDWEWTGLAKVRRSTASSLGDGHVFTGLRAHLPMSWMPVDCVEVDDLEDLRRAETWVVASDREGA